MTTLLIIIYIAFISLGLPDSLLGSAWPVIQTDLSAPVSFAGVISLLVCCGTVISSYLSSRFIRKFGTGVVTAASVAITAVALLLYSVSNTAVLLCLIAIPLGLGAGCVDAALNNFVALHYKASHMNWLHCFWGIGASLGPMIMSYCLKQSGNWKMGYFSIGMFQVIFVLLLIFTLPLWKRAGEKMEEGGEEETKVIPMGEILRIKYAKPVLVTLFCYCGLELTAGLWGSTYAVEKYGTLTEVAAGWTSVYYLGITAGRFLSGFFALKLSHKQLIRFGQILIFVGVVIVMLPISVLKVPIGMSLIGLGCAPIYPAMLHQTPKIFGSSLSQSMMGIQMACAYVGSALLPPLFGLIAENLSVSLYPIYLFAIILLMFLCTEYVNRKRENAM